MSQIPLRDLRVHDAGVFIMRELYPQLVATDDPRKVTHIDPDAGMYIRQKTDLYRFVNIFLEEFSVNETKAIGGPFQAYEDGCNSYCYYYPRGGKIIWTSLDDTSIQLLWDLIQKFRFNRFRTKYVMNSGYKTKGYTIPVWDYINHMGTYCSLVTTKVRNI